MPDAEDAAVRSGEEWGRYLVERPVPYQSIDRRQGIERLVDLLDDLGFSPATDGPADERILLRDCPFRETARTDSGVTRAVHLGMMRGTRTTHPWTSGRGRSRGGFAV